jgi:hypothetical protein
LLSPFTYFQRFCSSAGKLLVLHKIYQLKIVDRSFYPNQEGQTFLSGQKTTGKNACPPVY